MAKMGLPILPGEIGSHIGHFEFLGNNYKLPIEFEGIVYKNLQAAYQAQKTEDPQLRATFSQLSAHEAIKAGKTLTLRKNWAQIKVDVMTKLLRIKFNRTGTMAANLRKTEGDQIVEFNYAGETFWGVDHIKGGQNNLGKLLMQIRQEIK